MTKAGSYLLTILLLLRSAITAGLLAGVRRRLLSRPLLRVSARLPTTLWWRGAVAARLALLRRVTALLRRRREIGSLWGLSGRCPSLRVPSRPGGLSVRACTTDRIGVQSRDQHSTRPRGAYGADMAIAFGSMLARSCTWT